MISLTIEKAAAEGGASCFCIRPAHISMGSTGANLVDKLCLAIPAEWQGKTVRLTFVPDDAAQQPKAIVLDSTLQCSITGDITASESGKLLADAVDANGYAAYSAVCSYTATPHPAAGGAAPAYTADEYQQFVSQIQADSTAAAAAKAKAAQLAAAVEQMAKQCGYRTLSLDESGHLIETTPQGQDAAATQLDLGPVSAFALAVQNGFSGTKAAWLAALKGETGATGAKGDKGDPGETGATGAKGDKGDPGETGAAGQKGDKGDPGETGAAGAKGDKGDPGETGATGPKGDKGDPGETGAAGAKGDKGDPGETGATGAKGDKGDPGETGATGAKGDKGDPGETGATGAKGDKGDPGETGATGAKGDSVTGAAVDAQGHLILTIHNYATGTDTTADAGATDMSEAIAGLSSELLWENEMPSASFPAQTVSLGDTADYKRFRISCRSKAAQAQLLPSVCIDNTVGEATNLIGLSWASRTATVTEDGLSFSAGTGTSNAADNTAVVPYQIFGLRT